MEDKTIEIIDPRFTDLLAPGAKLEKLYTGMGWAEGPVWFADTQTLLFSDIPNDRMLQWCEGLGVREFRRPSNFANGHTRDRQGRLVSCEHRTRRVTRTEPDGTIIVLADAYLGKRLNSPNDVVVRSDGTVWFTDPTYGIVSEDEGGVSEQEQDGRYVFRLDPASGALSVAIDDFVQPNGLAFSPDESWLYVADSSENRHIRAFDVAADGACSGGEVFAVIDNGFPDGFRFDAAGNLWTSAGDGIHCLAPDGALLGKILVPETVANLTFGGPARDRLLITATTALYTIAVGQTGDQRP
jgi:gluconolactonase